MFSLPYTQTETYSVEIIWTICFILMPSEKTKLTVTPSEVFKISKNSDGAMPSEMISKGPSEKSLLERVCEYKNAMALYID